MSVRSFTKIWLHIIWATHNRDKLLIDRNFRKEVSSFLYDYSKEKNIYMKTNYINSDHVHVLLNLPTNKTVEEVLNCLKVAILTG
jgi:REP element-mobilizing transposase RayT